MLLFTKHVCCRYWRSWYYHKNNALLRILCCVVQFRQFGSGSVVPTTCLSSFCITGMKMLKPTTNRKKHPFISAWPWTIQAFVLGTLQGLATRNGCTNMHANVAHHEQLLQALNDTWKGFFLYVFGTGSVRGRQRYMFLLRSVEPAETFDAMSHTRGRG